MVIIIIVISWQVLFNSDLGMWFANCAVVDNMSGRSTGYKIREGFAPVVLDFDKETRKLIAVTGNEDSAVCVKQAGAGDGESPRKKPKTGACQPKL